MHTKSSTPDDLNVQYSGYNLTTGFAASSDKWLRLTVTATSDWQLVSDRGLSVLFCLASKDMGGPVYSWVFEPEELHKTGGTHKDMYFVVNYGLTSRAGAYFTNLDFTPSSERVNPVDLSKLTRNYTAIDGDILTGTAPANIGITISPGAEVTLSDANITQIPQDTDHKYAGITCPGDATLILSGDNAVKGGSTRYPGVHIAQNFTLTIKGTGSLMAESGGSSNDGFGAGIGGGYDIACGNIVIESGDIRATGGKQAAGIGGGAYASCGIITVSGGTVEATGGQFAPGIGSGYTKASCGTITITNTGGVTSVTATKGDEAPNSIGAGNNSSCDTVTIGGTEGAITQSPYTYPSN